MDPPTQQDSPSAVVDNAALAGVAAGVQRSRLQQQGPVGGPPRRYVPPHLRNRTSTAPQQQSATAASKAASTAVAQEHLPPTAGSSYPDYPGLPVAGSPYAPADEPVSGLPNGFDGPGLSASSPQRTLNTNTSAVTGQQQLQQSRVAQGRGGEQRISAGTDNEIGMLQQQQSGLSARAAALQMQQHGGLSSLTARSSSRASMTGTGWDVRDGRRYVPEKEREVFSSDKMQSTGIKFDSYDKVPVELKGRGAASLLPIESFQAPGMQIHSLLLQNVARVNYNKPTPIQKNSIPTILAGRDLMACAQTGSGKTAAFLYPIIARMLQSGPPPLPAARAAGGSSSASSAFRKATAYPVCLVLSPTRELAMQIYEEARKFQFGTGIRTVALYGGSDVKRQLYDLDGGCDICVATPGRLVDLLERRKVRLALVQFFVLDEADRMLDMGFLPQIKHIVEDFDLPPSPSSEQSCGSGYPPITGSASAYESSAPLATGGRQTVMFSATFPREIQMLAKDFLDDYIYLAVGRVGSTNEFIRQRLQYADEDQKLKLLVKLLRETEKGLTILFVETKRKADMIEDYLLEEDFPAVSIHGDRTQQEREEALRLFKAGKRPILVATDVAARGLDISNVTHVINFDLPTNIDDYVHRIGRTGRAGNLGLATSFVNECNKPILRDLMKLLEEAKQEVPPFLPPLVLSCTSSSARMGSSFRSGGWGGARGNSSAGRSGGGAFGNSRQPGYGSSTSMGARSGAMPMNDARMPTADWRSGSGAGGGNKSMGGFGAAVASGDRVVGMGMDAW